MKGDQLKARTRQFALDVIRLVALLGHDDFAQTARPQLLRAATGVAANYRGACRSRSGREFASRLAVVVEESDESELWLDFCVELGYGPRDVTLRLQQEALELRDISAKSRSTTLRGLREKRRKPGNGRT